MFGRYADRLMQRFGDRIAYAVTLNEPNLPARAVLARAARLHPRPRPRDAEPRPPRRPASRRTGPSNVVLPEEIEAIEDGLAAGHVAARDAIKARRPDLPVGLSIAVMDDVVVGDDPSVRDRKRAECYERWLLLARDDDFLGVQNYERVPYDANGVVRPPEGAEVNQMGTMVEPLSLAEAVRYAHSVAGVPVLVTEHGMATDDDRQRAAFIEPALRGLLDVIEDGVPVLGYTHWTLMDNFEWIFGYAFKLGLHEVDRETLERTPKPSAGVYAAIAKAHAVSA